jgi:hypothetical protein
VTHETGDVRQVIAMQAAKHWWLAQDSSPDPEVPESLVAAFVQALSDYALTAQPSEVEAEIARLTARLQIDPGGSDKIDELEEALLFVRHNNEQLEATIAHLREELAQAIAKIEEEQEHARRLVMRKVSQPAPSGWQPIESAPVKTIVLAWSPYHGVVVVRRPHGRWISVPSELVRDDVTHWMPLPPAPDAKDRKESDDETSTQGVKREPSLPPCAEAESGTHEEVAETHGTTRQVDVQPPCMGCGGPHPFDTSVPSPLWNRVIRDGGLQDYLCTTCIVQAFVAAGVSFEATLWGGAFDGHSIEVRVTEATDAKDAIPPAPEGAT